MVISKLLIYGLPLLLSFLTAFLLTPLVRKLAVRYKIVDVPGEPRKIHKKPTALLGGVAVFMSFVLCLLVVWLGGWLDDGIIKNGQLLAIVIGGLILIIGGVIDDKFKLKPGRSLIFPVGAALVAVVLGIGVKYVTNPFLSGSGPYDRALFYFDWVDLGIVSFGALFSWLWILGMIYTTKFLDGLDGLVSGVGAIGAIVLFSVSLFWDVAMSATSILCLMLAGSLLGFLVYNFHPAKIFLGEGGATFIGFMLGVLSIISGGKIATALLIMGVPILDVMWVILRRLVSGQHVYQADRKHLHFRLLDVGFSQQAAVLFLYALTFVFGLSSLFLQSSDKVLALAVLLLVMIILAIILVIKYKQKKDEL